MRTKAFGVTATMATHRRAQVRASNHSGNSSWWSLSEERRTEEDSRPPRSAQPTVASGRQPLGSVVLCVMIWGPEGGAGSRRGSAGRGHFPRARGARTVTATRARARPVAARPRDLQRPLRGARGLPRCRLGAPSRGVPRVPGPST